LAQHDKNVISWLMALEHAEFHRAIIAAWEYVEDQGGYIGHHVEASSQNRTPPKLRQPVVDFMRRLGAPLDLDPMTLAECLIGAGVSPKLLALFYWDHEGVPRVAVPVRSPIDAIVLSVHIDRSFSARRWAVCARCNTGFEQKKISERFCSKHCRNDFNTNHRRRKLQLLEQAHSAWTMLPREKRKSDKRWEWVVAWVRRKTKGEIVVESSWAKHQLSKK
jgi:hypothetical protein